jgi:hypothetical protein
MGSAASSPPLGTGKLDPSLTLLWQAPESRITEPEAQCWVSSSDRQAEKYNHREREERSSLAEPPRSKDHRRPDKLNTSPERNDRLG